MRRYMKQLAFFRHSWILFLSILFLTLVGCDKNMSQGPDKSKNSKEEEDKEKEEAIPIRTASIKTGKISNFVEASSVVEARYFVDIYPKISGEILKIYKEEGMEVDKKDKLIELDHDELDLDIDEAKLHLKELKSQLKLQKIALQEAQQQEESGRFSIEEFEERYEAALIKVNQTKTELERSKTMVRDFLISKESFEAKKLSFQEANSGLITAKVNAEKSKFDQKTQALRVSKAKVDIEILQNKIEQSSLSLNRAKLKLEDTQLLAPISGILSFANVQIGQQVNVPDLLFSIIDTQNLEIKIGIPEKDLRVVKLGQPVFLFNETIPLNQDSKPQGVVKAISPIVQKDTGTVKVTIKILKEFVANFKAGMFATVQIITETHQHAVLIPKKALLFDDNTPFIFMLEKDRVKKIFLRKNMIGFKDKFFYEVINNSEIQEGKPIVVVGQSGLKDNTLVKVVTAPK